MFCVTLAGAGSGVCVRKFPVCLHAHARLILQNALLLDASQAPLPREGESEQGRGSPGAGQGLQVVPLELSLTRKISSQAWFPKSGQPRQENCQGLFLLWYRGGELGIRSWQWLTEQAERTSCGILLCADRGLTLRAPLCCSEHPGLCCPLKGDLRLRKHSSSALCLCHIPALGWGAVLTK